MVIFGRRLMIFIDLLFYSLFRGQVFHHYVFLPGFGHIQTFSTQEEFLPHNSFQFKKDIQKISSGTTFSIRNHLIAVIESPSRQSMDRNSEKLWSIVFFIFCSVGLVRQFAWRHRFSFLSSCDI